MSNKEQKLVAVWVTPETRKAIKLEAVKKGITIPQEIKEKYGV